jgi:hypothetical protein
MSNVENTRKISPAILFCKLHPGSPVKHGLGAVYQQYFYPVVSSTPTRNPNQRQPQVLTLSFRFARK